MTTLSGIHHVGIVVENLEASVTWYVEHLGFERLTSFSWPAVQAAFIGRGALQLGLFQNSEAAPMAEYQRRAETNLKIGGINHSAIEVPDLDGTVATLGAKGVEVASPPREVPNGGGSRFAFIHDNERMVVELFQPA